MFNIYLANHLRCNYCVKKGQCCKHKHQVGLLC